MTLDEFTRLRDKYALHSMHGLKNSTKELNRNGLNEWEDFIYLGDHCLPHDIENEELYACFLNYLWKRHKREGPQRIVGNVGRFLKWCLRHGHIKKDPSKLVNPLKSVRALMKPAFTTADYQAVMASCTKPHLRWLFIVGWYTGMAAIDICELSVDEVDLNNGCITKRRSKTDTKCIVPIESGSMFHVELLRRIKEVDPTHRAHDPDNEKYYLCPELLELYRCKNGRGGISSVAKEVMLKAGVDHHKSFHSLRVAYCSMLANGGVNMGVACKMSGHSNPATFIKRYMKVKPAALHQALQDARAKQMEHEDAAFLD